MKDKIILPDDVLIDVRNVSMRFNLPAEKIDSLKEYFVKLLKGKLKYKDFWALNDVSFQVKRGESLALIGRNGAGKSTLLKLISGIFEPTKGQIVTRGTIAPLLKLGAGFDYNATGKENVFLNGAILGFSRKEMERKYDSIVEFSELKDFMNVPLKNYSSGMLTRLGFSIAVDVHPDILLIDEILAEKLLAAARDTGALAIALAGGVAANSLLRCLVNEGAQKLGAKLYLPEMQFCGDNGAMVAAQGYYELTAGNVAGLSLNGLATLPIDYNDLT